MKVFKYKFSKLITALIYVCLALCIAGFVINLYQVLNVGLSQSAVPTFTIIRYVLMFFVTVVLFVLLVSLLAHSNYTVKDGKFYTNFGFIKSKFEINDIKEITLDKKSEKLTLTFNDDTFMTVVVKPEWYDEFIKAIIEVNPRIDYYVNSDVNEDKDEKDKK
ncbi:MAG: PH domain-containing protein [Clostridia bacterium]|nr:PH domain-containing protein [Clostridia bacterium]